MSDTSFLASQQQNFTLRYPSLTLVILIAALPFVAASNAAETSARTMSAVDFVELEKLSHPGLSANGKHLVYQRQRVFWQENDTADQLRIVDLASGNDQLLIDPVEPDEDFGGVEWLPNGKSFITLLKRHSDKAEQAYLFRMEDRSLTRVSSHPVDVKSISWSPEGDGFYFSAESQLDEEIAERLDDDWIIEAYDSGQTDELWFFDTSTAQTTRLIGGDYDVRSYSVARDGKHIIYTRTDHTLGDQQDSELWLYSLGSQNTKRLTNNAYAENDAALSPDNKQIAYIATVNADGEHYYEDNVFVHSVESGKAELLLPDVAMEILDIEWDRDGSGLYLLGNTGLRTQLYHLTLDSQELLSITSGDHEILDWRYYPLTDSHVFIKRDAASPGEVWLLSPNDKHARQITHEFDSLDETFRLPQQEAFRWRGRDGVPLEGLLVYPVNYQPGKRFPLITTTHGGPRSSSQFGSWNMSRALAVFAGQGYGVFLPNHRGGTGYGDAFMRDMIGGYFNNAHLDVLDGIDALVSAKLADPDKLVKMGWSAGGHMTNKLITHTDRFKAASSGAGAADWVSMYAESDLRFNRTFWFGGAPWEENAPLHSYGEQSMLKDAWRITTPTLFFVGERDVRVPPTQSIMMHRGALAAGVDSVLYVAPREPHNYGKPKHRLFKINTELQWFAKNLGRKSYEPIYPDSSEQESP